MQEQHKEPRRTIWRVEVVTEGEWAGWKIRPRPESFEGLTGPFYYRTEEDGSRRAAFRAEPRHMNGGGFMHGGCLMTFADYCLFMIARDHLKHHFGVTASMNSDFLGSAHVGERVEGTGEVLKAGSSLIFVRGLITADQRPVLTWSGVIKKVKPRLPA